MPGSCETASRSKRTISNAQLLMQMDEGEPTPCCGFAPPPRAKRAFTGFAEIAASTPESIVASKTLRTRGFRFVGPTTMYALMQSSGMVDDHVVGCWRADEA